MQEVETHLPFMGLIGAAQKTIPDLGRQSRNIKVHSLESNLLDFWQNIFETITNLEFLQQVVEQRFFEDVSSGEHKSYIGARAGACRCAKFSFLVNACSASCVI